MLFDIDTFVKQSGGAYHISHYFEKIKKASTEELNQFRIAVKKHSKKPQTHRFGTTTHPQGKYKFSPHNEMLLPAINWELAQRSPFKKKQYDILFSLRKWWVGIWCGAELKRHKQLGSVVVYRKSGRTTLEYIGLGQWIIELVALILDYTKRHHWKIISAIIGILGILQIK